MAGGCTKKGTSFDNSELDCHEERLNFVVATKQTSCGHYNITYSTYISHGYIVLQTLLFLSEFDISRGYSTTFLFLQPDSKHRG